MKTLSKWASHGGNLSVYSHDSDVCDCLMEFAIYEPPNIKNKQASVLWYLSGLTCNWSNVMEKSGLQSIASKLGLYVIAPDTSPRSYDGNEIPDDEAYDLGQGAGFYLNATQSPWNKNFKMDSYITKELPELLAKKLNLDLSRQGITGHSMGGHGALTLHLKNPETYQSVSAFSPIIAPSQVPWGQKAFQNYLGTDEINWKAYDACELVLRQPSSAHILIDQGSADNFLTKQLQPEKFQEACMKARQKLTLRMQEGYDHSYYFVASFIADHLRHHADILTG